MKIAIIGCGNVGTHLQKAFMLTGHEVYTFKARDLTNDASIASQVLSLHPDVTLICVKDDMIGKVAICLKGLDGILAHTSGSTPIDVFADLSDDMTANHIDTPTRYGVFYPLQTFSRDIEISYGNIPFLIEGSESETLETLQTLATSVADTVITADSDKRAEIHLAGVLACNFCNYLWSRAYRYLKEKNIDFKILKPLIEQTLTKAMLGDPASAQTGPAVRGDTTVINRHMQMLSGNQTDLDLYKLLTDSIIKTCQK